MNQHGGWGICFSHRGDGSLQMCREQRNMGWNLQPAAGRQAVSEWRVCPSLHLPQLGSLQHYPALLLLSPCSPSHSTWYIVIASPNPCHTSFHPNFSPQSQPSDIKHIQFSTPCSFSCTRLLVQSVPVPSQLASLSKTCPSHLQCTRDRLLALIPIHISQVMFPPILHNFFAQAQ